MTLQRHADNDIDETLLSDQPLVSGQRPLQARHLHAHADAARAVHEVAARAWKLCLLMQQPQMGGIRMRSEGRRSGHAGACTADVRVQRVGPVRAVRPGCRHPGARVCGTRRNVSQLPHLPPRLYCLAAVLLYCSIVLITSIFTVACQLAHPFLKSKKSEVCRQYAQTRDPCNVCRLGANGSDMVQLPAHKSLGPRPLAFRQVMHALKVLLAIDADVSSVRLAAHP